MIQSYTLQFKKTHGNLPHLLLSYRVKVSDVHDVHEQCLTICRPMHREAL